MSEARTPDSGELVKRARGAICDGWSGDAVCLDGDIALELIAALESSSAEMGKMEAFFKLIERKAVKVPAKIYAKGAETIAWVQGANDALDAVRALSPTTKRP